MNIQSTTTLQNIFRAVFELPADADVTQFQQSGNERWDSLAHVSIVAALESEFGISIDAADQLTMTSYLDTQRLLDEKGV